MAPLIAIIALMIFIEYIDLKLNNDATSLLKLFYLVLLEGCLALLYFILYPIGGF